MNIEADLSLTQRAIAYGYDSQNYKPEEGMTQATIVRRCIESEIFSGKLLPGTQIDEAELAQRFSVSRTPVREALLALQQSGLIEKLPRRGAIVARLSLSRLIQLFELTSELEGLCAKYAATRINDEEQQLLIRSHEAAEAALSENDEKAYGRLGGRFHTLIMLASHNPVLVETTDKLALHTLPYRRFQVRLAGRSQSNQADHKAILDAILAKDGSRAAELMRKHVMVQGDVLAEYISVMEERVG